MAATLQRKCSGEIIIFVIITKIITKISVARNFFVIVSARMVPEDLLDRCVRAARSNDARVFSACTHIHRLKMRRNMPIPNKMQVTYSKTTRPEGIEDNAHKAREVGQGWEACAQPSGLVAQCSATPATVAATPPCSATPCQTQISVRHLRGQGGGGATPKFLGGVARHWCYTCKTR